MNTETTKKIIGLIQDNLEIAEFADYGDGISAEWLCKAEAAIGHSLPDSYKWWVSNYSGGEIGGEEIFSIYEEDFNDVIGGDIVYMYRLCLNESGGSSNKIPLCHSDVDGVFVFDVQNGIDGNEYSVSSEVTGNKYAENFFDFLEKRIACFV